MLQNGIPRIIGQKVGVPKGLGRPHKLLLLLLLLLLLRLWGAPLWSWWRGGAKEVPFLCSFGGAAIVLKRCFSLAKGGPDTCSSVLVQGVGFAPTPPPCL